MSTQVWIDKERIRVKATYAQRDVCKALPGARWDPRAKLWHCPATPEVAGQVFDSFGPSFQATREFLVLAGRAREAQEARALRDRTDLPAPEGERMPSWLHQKQAHHFAKGMDAVMLAVGMGGGKSKITVDLLEVGWPNCHRVLILAPNNVVKVWPKELNGAPEVGKPGHARRPWQVVNGLRVNRNGRLVAGSLRERKDLFKAAYDAAGPDRPTAIVVNYEAAPQGVLGEWLGSVEWDAVILDESHRIKSPGGVQSKFCASLAGKARKRACLTGTPMPHSPLDIYAQARFLDPGHFGTSYARFRQRYAVMGGFQGKQVLGMNEHLQPELEEKIARFSYIISNEELDKVLGLLDPVWPDTIRVPMSAKTRKVYDGLANALMAEIEDGVLTVDNALTQMLRLQQVTSGHVPVDRPCPSCSGEGCDACDGIGFEQAIVGVGTEKIDALSDWMKDLQPTVWSGAAHESEVLQPGEPLVVVCRFTADLDAVKAAALAQGRRYGELSGRDGSGLTRHATMSEDVDVLGVQIQAGGTGIDLSRARYVANFSVGFSLGDWLQWLKRTHRPGQKRRVLYQNFAVEGTIDEAVFRALKAREEVVKTVMNNARNALRGEL
jgi:hypothetical protein